DEPGPHPVEVRTDREAAALDVPLADAAGDLPADFREGLVDSVLRTRRPGRGRRGHGHAGAAVGVAAGFGAGGVGEGAGLSSGMTSSQRAQQSGHTWMMLPAAVHGW